MNYRHAFHAGNFADVIKHVILSRIIVYLKLKPAAFRVIDTHAGPGLYALDSAEALRNPEWRQGIAKVRAADLPDAVAGLLAPYLDAVAAQNPGGALMAYPGSPMIARHLLRPVDRLTLMELHPADAAALKAHFAGDVAVKTMGVNGWEALPANLPPKEKRGLVLIDPPFEAEGEFDRLVAALVRGQRHFATGIYALWYPLKDEKAVEKFKKSLYQSGIAKILCAEFRLRAPSTPPRLFGSGMIIVNPPYTLANELETLFAALLPVLSEAQSARFEIGWVRGE